jgi:hypothetical protein
MVAAAADLGEAVEAVVVVVVVVVAEDVVTTSATGGNDATKIRAEGSGTTGISSPSVMMSKRTLGKTPTCQINNIR